MKFHSFILKLLAVAIALCVAATAGAQMRLTESFAAPVGGVPENWRAALVRKDTREAVVGIVALSGAEAPAALLIEREGRLPESGALYYTGSEGQVKNGNLADLSATVTFRFNETVDGPNTRGFILRSKRLSYARFEGYYVAVTPRGGSRSLAIFYNPQNHVENGVELASTPLASVLNPNTDYILSVSAKGPVIEATLQPAGAAAGAKPLATVRTEEATQASSGYFGLRAAYSNSGPLRTWFRQLHLTDSVR